MNSSAIEKCRNARTKGVKILRRRVPMELPKLRYSKFPIQGIRKLQDDKVTERDFLDSLWAISIRCNPLAIRSHCIDNRCVLMVDPPFMCRAGESFYKKRTEALIVIVVYL